MDRLKIRLLIIFFAVIPFLWCEEIDPEMVKQNLIEHYTRIETYQADFQQANYWQELDLKLNSSGKIFYNRSYLKLQYEDPEGQFLLLDSLYVTMYDPGSNQAIIASGSEIDIRPLAIISRYWDNSLLQSLEQANDTTYVSLKTANDEFIDLVVYDNRILELIYADLDKNWVKYRFRNERINAKLPPELFEVHLPEDVNLIDNRQ
jgi:outer membrane lipoprotein-sorting protein